MSESAAIPTSLSVDSLSAEVRSYVEKWAEHCKPLSVHVCDGSEEEDKALLQLLQQQGSILPLSKLENW
jgi:phosphoenolpyruvate carboxykinase (GTP)